MDTVSLVTILKQSNTFWLYAAAIFAELTPGDIIDFIRDQKTEAEARFIGERLTTKGQ